MSITTWLLIMQIAMLLVMVATLATNNYFLVLFLLLPINIIPMIIALERDKKGKQ